jgi:raw score 9.21
MYFFDNHINAFLVEGLHDIPVDAIAVSDNEYEDLVAKRDIGCLLYVDDNQVKATPPQPSPTHEWDGKDWVISPEKQTALLAERKTQLLNVIANKTDNFKAQYLVGYSQAEIDSFYRQEREARNELPTMLLTEIFEGRDDLSSIEELKKKVIEKADLFAIIMGKLFAIKQGFEKHIDQAETIEQLDKIEQEINQWQKL